MQKQAFGVPVHSEMIHHQGTYATLRNPERPLTLPAVLNNVPNCELLYSGQTALTAIMPVRGLNQEDGLVFSQGAINRGLLTSLHHYCYRKTEPDFFTLVQKTVKPGTCVKEDDVLIFGMSENESVRVTKSGGGHVSEVRLQYLGDSQI